MKKYNISLTFFSNYLNHHQVVIADELYNLLGDNFHFVSTLKRDEKELKGDIDYSSRSYCVLAAESSEGYNKAIYLAKISDVCIFGAYSQEFALIRAKQKYSGLSFEVAERWLKKGWSNILSPRLIKWWWNYQRYYRRKNFYKLCSSAFAAYDDRKMFAYLDRHFKWGYFTRVDESNNIRVFDSRQNVTFDHVIHIMWCSRFINWKHPELPIYMAKCLKNMGYTFMLDMYGTGNLERKMKQLTRQLNVDDVVKFHGSLPNSEIILAMQKRDIFIFTSDRNEGWGAVANEAMANGCVLIVSDAIGCAPYLIKDCKNGFFFKSKDIQSLTEKVAWVLQNPMSMQEIQKEAYKTMIEIWSPKNAAKALLRLIDDLQNGNDTSIIEGPCSKA